MSRQLERRLEMRTLILVVAMLVAAGVAAAAPPELATSNLNTPAGRMTALAAKTVYQASSFPLGLRLAAPDGTWAGSQWTTSAYGKKTFAWVAVGHGGTTATSAPQGVIALITAIGPTPSVPATVARIRQGGSGVTFEKASSARVAGYTGTQFDGNVWGVFGHSFVPFTPRTRGAAPSDSWHIDKGEAFRFTVLGVKGKTVVVFEESFGLPADQFPAFLAGAKPMLASLKFTA
jgi:hypothetical protein